MVQQSAVDATGVGASRRGASGAAAAPASRCMAAQSVGMSAAVVAANADPSGTTHAIAHAAATPGEAVSSRTTAAAIARRTTPV